MNSTEKKHPLLTEEGKKVLIAIDLSNLYCQVKSVHSGNSVSGDYCKIIKNISPNNDNLVLCFAAISNPVDDLEGYSRTRGLHNLLRHIGFIVHTVERRNSKADGDVLLAVKSIEASLLNDYDRFVLISADGDYVPLLEHFRTRGIKTTVASVESHISSKLKTMTDDIIDLHEWASDTFGGSKRTVRNSFNKKSITPLEKAVDTLHNNIENPARRRGDFVNFSSAVNSSIVVMNGKNMKAHRSILTTLRDAMELFDPKILSKDDMSLLKKIVRGLLSKDPNIRLCDDIRNQFIIKPGSDSV